jgi:hypothetical protein
MTETATAHKPTDLRATFGFHAIPFTRQIATDNHLRLPFLDEALAGLLSAALASMPAPLSAPAGTGKTALLRRLRSGLAEARYHVHDVKVTGRSKRDMGREIAAACGAQPASSFPMLNRRLRPRLRLRSRRRS